MEKSSSAKYVNIKATLDLIIMLINKKNYENNEAIFVTFPSK